MTTRSKEKRKRQSEFGMEMQSHEVSGGNAELPDASNTRLLMQSSPAQGKIIDPHGSKGKFLMQSLSLRLQEPVEARAAAANF